jgi:branched-chain amino acid transport system ATP-binding protein
MFGALVFEYISNVVSGVSLPVIGSIGSLWRLVLGTVFVLVVWVLPGGVAGARARRRACPRSDRRQEPGRGGCRRGRGAVSLLRVDGLTKEFGGLTAVDGVTFGVESGETRAVIGPNGAGKSTLINCVTGLLRPTAGVVEFDGRDITDAPPHETVQAGMSKSFQTVSLFPSMTVAQNVEIAALAAENGSFSLDLLRRRDRMDGVHDIVDRMLDAVDLTGERDVEAESLPYGDKRRLEIGVALASEPEMLFMDEPTAGMSPDETADTVDLVEELRDDLGLTILIVEHDMEIIFRVADRIVVLNRGAVIADGTPETVQGNPDVQEAYLGGVEL